ncbi:MAG TPA: CDP-diacylglycerol--glycerol-3-phosphate 3-phosphatidyltransferase [Sphaerochaeta sp.]|jgi:CDP-diacylglycerol--glycerol-3-phosphate 3-phosphatidyltransferase|nr:CDP-diacylglycerol--glycerol-3-phosphate 3-phosphatidyltransferase [Sphaerochaeta sp.]HPY44852.1 CDP-diacylglycerol--glycerol-3-phosphate 3-phosphatidyltransferase [Sphaerochaeta sp.]HQB04306.1 CDP-diacylglycerol--glycerol-3-phosphate 3-phosphatidyltransferase [Sphaerochaeta sp.]
MNLPNKLTVSRLVLTPLFFIAYHLGSWIDPSLFKLASILTIVMWVLIEASDLFDGIIARKRNLVTDLGKVMDPFADTLSRVTYFLCFTGSGIMPLWALALIVWRELSILFVRMLMMGKGKAVAANIFGKAKAVLYAISGGMGILYGALVSWGVETPILGWGYSVMQVVFALAAISSVASFLTYVRAIIASGALSGMSR